MRGVIDIEEDKKSAALIIKEIPYQVNKSDLITKIADLVKNKVIEGISNIRDESARQGIRLVIELKRGEIPQVIVNQLYTHTSLQSSMSIIMLALYDNKPMFLTLREMLDYFLLHRKEIITKRCEFDLDKFKSRGHVLDGLIIALDNIDSVIILIKASQTAEEASEQLNKKFNLSEKQCKAILEMRLQRLTGLERDKINEELVDIKKNILRLEEILASQEELVKEIIKELEQIKASYADPRKTKIEGAVDILSEADLIPDDDVVVTLTRRGYIKRVPLETYTLQHRGGRGKQGITDLEELDDVIQDAFVTRNHDELLFFTNLGRIFSLDVFQIPEGSRIAKGRAIVNLLQMPEEEKVVKLLCTRELEGKFLVMVTKSGVIKKTNAMEFAKIRKTGIRAISLDEGDELVFCGLSSGSDSIILATSRGQGIRFDEKEVRSMGRQAAGVRGIKLKAKDFVVGMEIISDGGDILFASAKGFGKRVKIADFRVAHRGGLGVRTIPTTSRNGAVIGLVTVSDQSEVLLIDTNGKIIRLSPQEIRTMGRQAAGVRLVRLDETQTLLAVKSFEAAEDFSDKSKPGSDTSGTDTSGTDTSGTDGSGVSKVLDSDESKLDESRLEADFESSDESNE
jgi:DNA gyrase subunit A